MTWAGTERTALSRSGQEASTSMQVSGQAEACVTRWTSGRLSPASTPPPPGADTGGPFERRSRGTASVGPDHLGGPASGEPQDTRRERVARAASAVDASDPGAMPRARRWSSTSGSCEQRQELPGTGRRDPPRPRSTARPDRQRREADRRWSEGRDEGLARPLAGRSQGSAGWRCTDVLRPGSSGRGRLTSSRPTSPGLQADWTARLTPGSGAGPPGAAPRASAIRPRAAGQR